MKGAWLDRISVAIATGMYISYIPCALAKHFAPGLGRSTGAGFAGTALGLALLPLLPRDGTPDRGCPGMSPSAPRTWSGFR